MLVTLGNKHGDNLEEKSLTICSGTDYININYLHVICPDAETAKVRHEPIISYLSIIYLLSVDLDHTSEM